MKTDKTVLESLKGEENPRERTLELMQEFDKINSIIDPEQLINLYHKVHTDWASYWDIEFNKLPPELDQEKKYRQGILAAARSQIQDRMPKVCMLVKGKERRARHREFWKAVVSAKPHKDHVVKAGKKALNRVTF